MEIAIFTVSFLFAAFGVVAMAQMLRLGLASTQWPSVRGTVVRSGVRSSGSYDEVSYCPDVSYRYTVGGRELTGRRLAALVWEHPNREGAERKLAHYPDGAEVTVFYNPAKPEESVLERGIAPAAFTVGAFGALAVLALYLGARLVGLIIH